MDAEDAREAAERRSVERLHLSIWDTDLEEYVIRAMAEWEQPELLAALRFFA